MVGLKSIWITISALLLLAACVPQTKQSSCGSNEAFNASLRTCVPVIGGPESFVTVQDFVPASVVSKSKDDYVLAAFTITVSNPYNQSYSVIWERTFNGNSYALTPDASGKTVEILPANLGLVYKQLGIHVITAKIKVGSNIVDSHNFQLVINDTPKPVVRTVSITPTRNAVVDLTPASPVQAFNFFIDNNINLDPLHDWKTTWTVVKNTSTYDTEVDSFTQYGETDTNFPEYLFDPSVAGIGSYTIRAVVSNNPPLPLVGEVVDEVLWLVNVQHPDIGKVIAANSPLVSTDTIAFHGVTYDTWGFRNGVSAATTKSNFCVQVDKPEGAYQNGTVLDPMNYGVKVRYYKDGVGSPIFEGYTDASILKSTVCFSEASLAEQANLFYADGSSTVPHYKSLVARVFDAQTELELCVDGTTCSMAYPISWKVLVRPRNTPITARILNSVGGDNISYASAPTASTTSINATVTQDTNFIVRFSLADLAGEYDTALDLDKFKYTAVLKRGSTIITGTGCNKDFTDTNPLLNSVPQDNVGAVYECQFNIASSDASGPIAPGAHTLTILAEDLESPVPGSTGVLANLLTWNLTVNEANTAPSISLTNILVGLVPTPTPDEGQTITFQLAIDDLEKDTYNLTIYKCSEATCTSTLTSFAGNSSTLAYGSTNYNNNRTVSFYIPEDEIGEVASGTIYFKAVATDAPSTAALSLFTELIVPVTVNQMNHAPVINVANLTSPAVNNGAAYDVLSGNRFSISTTGAVTDASDPSTSEATLSYQWWISEEGAGTWTAIDGATDATLRWTPGPEINPAVNHEITFCVTDGSFLRPSVDPAVGGSICSPQYYLIKARTNLAALVGGSSNGEIAVHHVPSERTVYTAYATGGTVNVQKFTYGSNGALDTSGMRLVSFNAVSTTATMVKNISLASSSTSLYVAYLADDSSTPSSFKARIRRINISNTAEGSKTHANFAASTRKFGFSYAGSSLAESCASAPANCTIAGRTITFNGDPIANTDTITVNGDSGSVIFGVNATATADGVNICGGCTAPQQAASLANLINSSSSQNLQGVTAVAAGNVVTLYGVEATNVYDSTDIMLAIGKIVYDGTRWYLPVVNSGLLGADQNKIQILNNVDASFAGVDVSTVLDTLETASSVDNALTTSNTLLIGYTTLSGSVPKVIELNGTMDVVTTPLTLFSGAAMTEIKVKAGLGVTNPNVFVVAKNASNIFYLARLPSSLASITSQKTLSDSADTSDAVNTTILGGDILDVSVEPALPHGFATTTNEARVIVISDSGATDYNSYLFRWKQIAGVDYLDVSEGQYLENSGAYLSPTSKAATSSISTVTIGTAGSTASENSTPIMAVGRVTSGNSAQVVLLNSKVETINSTTRDATGLFRPALVR